MMEFRFRTMSTITVFFAIVAEENTEGHRSIVCLLHQVIIMNRFKLL